MKKHKKAFLVGIILAVLLIISLSIYFGVNAYEKHMADIEKQEANRLKVENTYRDFNFYLENEPKDDDDEIVVQLNKVIIESEKNETIDFDKFLKESISKLEISKVNKTIEPVEKEISDYDQELLNFTIDLESLDTSIYDKDTLIKIYNEHEFIKNLESEKQKREDYLKSLTSYADDLNSVKKQSSLFYKSGNVYMAQSDAIVNDLNAFGKKYGLKLNVQKEFLVPILCYHGVLDEPWGINSLFVRVSEFESQMKYLSENGYTPLFVSELASAKNYKKPVLITFDDGYKDVYTNAFPILKKYNIKANVYMISGWINGDVYMTTSMTQEMANSPLIEIGSHTVDHKALATLSLENIEKELKESKESLESITGQSINVIAYPTGSYDSRVINVASKYYSYGLSTNNGKVNPSRLNHYALNRIYVYRGTGIDTFKGKL